MSYVVFARKYRPGNFDEIVGQEHIATTLKNAIKQGRVAHAYLFSGPRGIGKTTTARILAKALNCEKGPTPTPCNKCASCQDISASRSMDVIEIDGASNRGIDEVRELRENVKFAASGGRYKLYIIDEVHMLTPEAFNALLKTLEEPPPHVKFIFATTQPNKVLSTILSRCQKFDFRRIATAEIVSKLKKIAKRESIKTDDDTLFLIARQSEGSLRDAESMLDQVNTFTNGKIKKEDLAHILGVIEDKILEEFAQALIDKDAPKTLEFIDKLVNEGKELSIFLSSLIEYFRDLMVAKVSKKARDLIDRGPKEVERIAKQSQNISAEEILYISSILNHGYNSMKRSALARVVFELAVTKITTRGSLVQIGELLEKIEKREKAVEEPKIEESKIEKPRIKESIKEEPKRVELKREEPKGEPVKAPEADTINTAEFSQIQKMWPTMLKLIRSRKISVASYMLEANPLSLSENTLTIGFPSNYSLHKEALDRRENKDLVIDTLKEILHIDVRIKFILQEDSKDETRFITKESYSANKISTNEEVLKEPVVQSALEVFDGRIVKRTRR